MVFERRKYADPNHGLTCIARVFHLSSEAMTFRPTWAGAILCAVCLAFSGVSTAQIYQHTAPDGTLQFSTRPSSGQSADKVIGGRKVEEKSARTHASKPNPNPHRSSHAFDEIIRAASDAYGVPYAFIKAVIRAESGFNPHAVSHAGAAGLMQLMPSTAEALNCSNPFDPHENIFAGTQYLRILLNRYNGDMNLVLAAYNAGSGAVARANGIPFQNTQRYIERVYRFYLEYLEE